MCLMIFLNTWTLSYVLKAWSQGMANSSDILGSNVIHVEYILILQSMLT